MLSADLGSNMSSIERLVAAIFLAGAVAGAAAFGHLLGSEAAAPTSLVSLLPPGSPSRGTAVKAEPAPPLPALIPRLAPAHRPLRIASGTARPLPARPVTRAITFPVTKPAPQAATREPAPQAATTNPAPQAATTKATPQAATPAPPSTPAAAPVAPKPAATLPPVAAPAPPDVQVVLSATEQVVAPDDEQDDDQNQDNHDDGDHGGHEHHGDHGDRGNHGNGD
jgi:hypothetical protein